MQGCADPRRTICWECRNTSADKCSWFHPKCARPVDGWEAIPTKKNGISGQSYLVINCPNFEPDERVEFFCRGISVTEEGKLSVDIVRDHKLTHIGIFDSVKDALLASATAVNALYTSAHGDDCHE